MKPQFASRRRIRALAAGAALAAAALAPAGGAQAWTFKTLYSFCSQNGCADGEDPLAGLLIDASGNLYGTTLSGGKSVVQNGGVVFQLARQGETWTYSVLYSFCSRHRCNDGGRPVGRLISDIHGALYGTTSVQGDKASREGGTVFRLAPNQDRSSWNFRRLYAFCQHEAGCLRGGPNGGLTYFGAASGAPYDLQSALHGTTIGGGACYYGVVFGLRRPTDGGHWSETVNHEFCGADGRAPYDELWMDESRMLFGVTAGGGSSSWGTVYQLDPRHGIETVLHNFCSLADCADGAYPAAGVVADSEGNFFGLAASGGLLNCPDQGNGGCGTAYKLIPNGANSKYSVLYAFCAKTDCQDGSSPQGGVIVGASGNLYGTTWCGGGHDIDDNHCGGGTVFKLAGAALETLYSFCAQANCTDGEHPSGNLTMDAAGNLYGVTIIGGAHGGGTVFELMP